MGELKEDKENILKENGNRLFEMGLFHRFRE